MKIQINEFVIGQLITFKPYDKSRAMYVVGWETINNTLIYKLSETQNGKPIISSSGKCIIESKLFED